MGAGSLHSSLTAWEAELGRQSTTKDSRSVTSSALEGPSISYLSVIYFSFSSCLVDILLVNELLGLFYSISSISISVGGKELLELFLRRQFITECLLLNLSQN